MLDREYQYNCTQIHLCAIYQIRVEMDSVESRIASVPMPYECGKPRHTTDEIYRHNDDQITKIFFFFAHGRTSYLLRMCEEVILLYNQYQAKSPSSILRLHN